MRPLLPFLVWVAYCLAPLAAQTPVPAAPSPGAAPAAQVPPRDNQTVKPGTAVIRGRVVAADTGEPMRRAVLRASSPALQAQRQTVTDADGRYELKELPAGRYSISASKGSYVSLTYGQTRSFEAGRPLDVGEGQTIEKVDFSLPHGAVVTGHVVDEFGEPIADAQVAPMRWATVSGSRRLVPSGRGGTSNDIGEFRIYGLPPGQYLISATMRSTIFNAQSDDRAGSAFTYYPGTANPAEAQRLDVALGQTITEINIPLIPTRTARVSGTVVDLQGRPFTGGMLNVRQRNGTAVGMMSFGAVIQQDGTFVLAGLSPGDYVLQPFVNRPFDDAETIAFAPTAVSVAGEDVTGIRLAGVRPSTVSGRIVFTDATAAGRLLPGALRPSLTPKDPEENGPCAGAARVHDDFTFEIKACPRRSLVQMFQPPRGWSLRMVRLNSADVTDDGFEIKPGDDVGGVEIEMTNRPSAVTGLVTNVRGAVVKDYSLLLFPQDREKWGPGSRYTRTSRPDQNGRFDATGLPEGTYYAIALEYLEDGTAADREFLDRVQPKAVAFSLGEGETKSLDLKLSSLDDR